MKRFVKFILYETGLIIWPVAAVLLLLLFLGAQWASGGLTSIAYDEAQNIRFEAALNGQPPLPALIKARETSPAFEARMRRRLADTANRLLQGRDPGADAGDDTARAEIEWIDTHICGLEGWRDFRPVIRKLVSHGFGDCGWTARWRADSPLIYDHGALGWLGVVLLWLLFITATAAAIVLLFTRHAHQWLYASRIF